MRKVITIGLDGGTFDLLMPLIEKGCLPTLKAIMDDGVWGTLRTVVPPSTGPAWSSIVTGLDPSNHGVFDLIVRAADSYNLAFLNAGSLRAPTVWDSVGAFGGRVVVMNVPMTYPPTKVNGLMVTGLLTPLGSRRCTYPPELLDSIRKIEPSYKIVPAESYTPTRAKAFLDEVTNVFDSKAKVLKRLLSELDWNFAMQVFSETDFLQHGFWHAIDSNHPRHNKDEYRRYAQRIWDFYSRIDTTLGELLESLGENVSVVIVSDHGAGPLHEFIHVNNLLLKKGMMEVRRDLRSRLKYLLYRMGFTPFKTYRVASLLGLGRIKMGLRWTSKGYGLMRRLFFSFSDIDWERTSAYAISGGFYGGVSVNLKGREPQGFVDKGHYDEVRASLKNMLLELRHPETGEAMVKDVFRREDLYQGRFAEEALDLYFLPAKPTLGVFGDFEFSSNRVIEPASEVISAQHRMDGIFLAKGDGIKQGAKVENMTVMDVAPLLLYLVGVPNPEKLDGRLPEEVFTTDQLKRRPPAYCKLEDLSVAADRQRQSGEDESIKARLKGLGYIS